MIQLHNENCLSTMQTILPNSIDVILTSPPYNMTKRKGGISDTGRYDEYIDWKTEEEYLSWMITIFQNFHTILKANGVILFNFSYSIENPSLPYKLVSKICEDTSFDLVDTIIWKKKNGIPFPANCRRLSRIWEYVYVFVRKSEVNTYSTNRQIVSISEKTGQKYYESIYNYIEAKNNDGKCSLNQATYSSELCEKLLNIYAKPKSIIYDPFIGTGTTAVACKRLGLDCIGSEISEKQINFATQRLEKFNC